MTESPISVNIYNVLKGVGALSMRCDGYNRQTPLFITHRPAHFGLLSQVPIVQSQYNLEEHSFEVGQTLGGAAV